MSTLTIFVFGFNFCLLLAVALWFMLRTLSRDPGAVSRVERQAVKPRGETLRSALWELKWVALWLVFSSWLAFRSADKPKPQASYYGNPHWWEEVQASARAPQLPGTVAAQLDSDPVYVSPARAGAQLPDRRLTPGKANPSLTAKELCNPHFHTRQIRAVDDATKHKVCAAYGVQPSDCNGHTLEIDHLISLELGGSNDPRNLWPQYFRPKPGAHEKDQVENWLHRQVCSGAVSLGEAQREISQDWYGVYLRMPKAKAEPPHRGR